MYISWPGRAVRGKKNKTRSDIHIKRSWYVVDAFKASKLVKVHASWPEHQVIKKRKEEVIFILRGVGMWSMLANHAGTKILAKTKKNSFLIASLC